MSTDQDSADYRRDQIVRKAVDAADRIIDNSSDGSIEQTNRLTADLAMQLMNLALMPFNTETALYHTKKSSERNASFRAFDSVRKVIADSKPKNKEEFDYLTARVAKKFVDRSLNHFDAMMLKKDLEFA